MCQNRNLSLVRGRWILQFQCPHRNCFILYLSNSLDCHSLERSGGCDSIWLCQLGRKNNYSKKEYIYLMKYTSSARWNLWFLVFPGLLRGATSVRIRFSLCACSVIHSFVCLHIIIAMRSAQGKLQCMAWRSRRAANQMKSQFEQAPTEMQLFTQLEVTNTFFPRFLVFM